MLRLILLEDVVLNRAAQLRGIDSLALSARDVEREQDRRRTVDRHRSRDAIHRDLGHEQLHVLAARDRDADLPDLAHAVRVVGVVAHQRREVERDRQARLPVIEQELEALVGLRRGAEAGELAHGPQTTAVHGRMNAARERELSGPAQVLVEVNLRVRRAVDGRERLRRRAS